MIVVGVALLGLIRLKSAVGHGLAQWFHERVAGRGVAGAYALGVAFSFAFCPTLFWLFFGLTVPLALQSSAGWTFPGLFAVGSSLPLLVVTGVVAAGFAAVGTVTGLLQRIGRPLRVAAGGVLVLAGVHDTLVYWLL